MLTDLSDATADTCGGKAAALAVLLRAGLPVPDGFVVPFAVHATHGAGLSVPDALSDAVARHLALLGDPLVAVRSSADAEDQPDASAAGQYDSVLGVRGTPAVLAAVRTCWASLRSARALEYRSDRKASPGEASMAVLIQRLVDADASGVMFTPAHPGASTRIEASWGLGPSVVGGTVTPDTYEIAVDGSTRSTIARKATRLDRANDGTGVTANEVPERQRTRPALDAATTLALTALGHRIAAALGGPQDVEWALADGKLWILQARPITAPVPPLPTTTSIAGGTTLSGTPGSHGIATGIARVLGGPSDFGRVRPGDIVVCPYTDPAWTALLRIAAGIVTETGGALSHAAIVAREQGIPAVLGVPDATTAIRDGDLISIDGTEGAVTTPRPAAEDDHGNQVPVHRAPR
ncbi:PEP/pyruvate-binding domain-containing protein [Occultella gossypii]|uniref:Pyruvate, phosphate dikinase n=1 Tax=Occultella gossypii TaxID=2800820 RepID=A0ABS7SAT4_9MICO|nr:PEP/pyruvate-binding domain-containing protein [Occultella gossypii]MBZ2196794.1 pyruvate, phosphate dikinase [Occultella gossypii]